MRLTKNDIVAILRKAPMTPGDFALLPQGHSLNEEIGSLSGVKYDVIGAIVRAYLPSTRTFRDLINTCLAITQKKFMAKDPLKLIKEGNPLGALSAHFENVTVYSDDVVDDSVREEMEAFVHAYFPNEIEVSGV